MAFFLHDFLLVFNQVMKMMGLSNAVHWCAWFLTTCLQMTATTAMLTAMLKLGKVLPHSDASIVFIVLQVYAIAIISFSSVEN
jgi:hypothetical protein